MAFGYNEPEHTVEQEVTQDVDGKKHRLQLRAKIRDEHEEERIRALMASLSERMRANTVPRDFHKYIAIDIYDSDGKWEDGLQLMYKDNGADPVAADWEKLIASPHVKSSDLEGWYVKIHQGMGYLRGGGWIMY